MRAVGNPTNITTHVRLPTDQAGNALPDPLSAYKISDQDTVADPVYYGYVAADGAWYIMKQISVNSFRYTAGGSNYGTAWSSRASLGYDYFDRVF